MITPSRRIVVMVALVVAAVAAWFVLRPAPSPGWLGYVEGETIYVAAPVSGRLALRPVERGQAVAAGAALFSLDPETSDAELARAEAGLAAARASAADAGEARARTPELAALRAARDAASARLTKAQQDFARIAALNQRGFASNAQLDAARAARDAAAAEQAQTRAQLAAGEISAGRSQQIVAARAEASGAEAALRGERQRRREIAPLAPEKGIVEQTFYNPGEWVPANSPVVALLPDARRKLRFYVPEGELAALRPGMSVSFTCDGCGDAPRSAQISYISPRAEFTPPVIYSETARAKLVFLIEALLPASGKPLPPGLPVSVALP